MLFQNIRTKLEDMLSPVPLSKVVEHQMEQATTEIAQAQHVILTHRFQEHMARAKIEALEDWNHNRNLRA